MKALEAIREAVKTKELKKDQLSEKLQRIENCKKEYFSTYQPIYIPKISDAFNSPAARRYLININSFKRRALSDSDRPFFPL